MNKNFNYFSAREVEIQYWFRGIRDAFLKPFMVLLAKLGVTPDFITGLGLLVLVPYLALVTLFPHERGALGLAFAFVVIHVLLDGLDGSLARYLKVDDAKGSLTDMGCDHFGMVIVVLGLAFGEFINGALSCLYVFVYTIEIVFVIWLNIVGRPFKVMLRSKYLLYLAFGLYAFSGINILNELMLVFGAYHMGIVFIGFRRMRDYLKGRREL